MQEQDVGSLTTLAYVASAKTRAAVNIKAEDVAGWVDDHGAKARSHASDGPEAKAGWVTGRGLARLTTRLKNLCIVHLLFIKWLP